MAGDDLGTPEKRARCRKATLIFLDETGLLLTPLVVRTWAPRGESPVLVRRTKRTRKVSAIGALSISPARKRLSFVCELHSDRSIKGPEVLRFLRDLRRQFGPLLVVWDRLQAHRSKVVNAYLKRHPEITTEFLPTYAPDLNPVELVWRHAKGGELANFCPADVEDLSATAETALSAYADKPHLLAAFLRHTGLPMKLNLSKRKHLPESQ